MSTNASGGLNTAKMVGWGVLALVVIVLLFSVFGTVGAQERGVKVRLGVVKGVVPPGVYFKLPWPIDKVYKMDLKVQTLEAPKSAPLSAASNDLQDTKLAVVVNYQLNPGAADDIYIQYGSSDNYYDNVVTPLIVSTIKAVASQYTAADQIQKRQEMAAQMLSALQTSFEGKDITISKADITDISFSDTFTQAIEAKVTAVQNAEAAKNKLAQVQYEAQQTVAKAQADAEAIKIQAQAINSQGGADYVKLQLTQKWDGHGCTSYCGLDASTGLLIQGH